MFYPKKTRTQTAKPTNFDAPFSGYETAKNMELMFSHQACADLHRSLLGEFVLFDNQ